jgi:hypothetical protein
VWVLLQQKIDDVLDGIFVADLLLEESAVRARVGLTDPRSSLPEPGASSAPRGVRAALPVLGG